MKRAIRRILNRFGYDVTRLNPTEIGGSPLCDMKRFLHNDQPLIFDIGANVGQSVRKFREELPNCTIHSFEPSPTTFELLRQNVSAFENLHLRNCALGSSSGQMSFLENTKPNMSSFLPLSTYGWGEIEKETLVEVETIDQYCSERDIQRMDILKSDTQGFDLEVLKGAEETIQENKVGLVYLEIIFSDMYEYLPSLAEIYEFLVQRDFLLVSFYDFYYQDQLASWTDALFVHKSYAKLDL